jgi:hypothetical protein
MGEGLPSKTARFNDEQGAMDFENDLVQYQDGSLTVDGIMRESLRSTSKDDHNRPKRRCPGIVVERPIAFRGHRISFDHESKSRTAFKTIDWYFPVLDRYLEVGFSNEALVSVFSNIPDELALVLKQSLHALQIIRASDINPMARTELDLTQFTSTEQPRSLTSILEDGQYDDQGSCGILHVHWDPTTQVSTSRVLPWLPRSPVSQTIRQIIL